MASFLGSAAARFGAKYGSTSLLSAVAAASTVGTIYGASANDSSDEIGSSNNGGANLTWLGRNGIMTPSLCEAAASPAADVDVTGDGDDSIRTNNNKDDSHKDTTKDKQKVSKQLPTATAAKLKTRMTEVGRFSLLSETSTNPSMPCLIIAMTGKPLLPQDVRNLYKKRSMAQRYPRFSVHLDDKAERFVPMKDPESMLDENIREMFYPIVPRLDLAEAMKDGITQPLDMTRTLWQIRVATNGAIGQSGAISTTRAAALQKEFDDGIISGNHDNANDHGTVRSATQDDGKTIRKGAAKPAPRAAQPITALSQPVESLLMFRAHHCLADGMSLAAVFSDFTDEAEELQQAVQEAVAKFKRRGKSWLRKLQIFLFYWCLGSLRSILYHLSLGIQNLVSSNPWKVLKKMHEEHQADLASSNIDEDDTESSDVGARNMSWAEVATIEEVKEVAKHYSTKGRKMTVNDVFASCVTTAIHRLLEHHRGVLDTGDACGCAIPTLKTMNLVVPVHLMGGIILPNHGIGNKIGAMLCQLPCEQADLTASQRLRMVHDRMTFLKQTPAAFLSYLVAKVLGGIGSKLGGFTPFLFSKAHFNASAVLTNIRGPDRPLHLGGRKLQTVLGFLPLPPGIPLGIVILSYNNSITLTVCGEPWAVPNADLFLSYVVEEYQNLVNEAKQAKESVAKQEV